MWCYGGFYCNCEDLVAPTNIVQYVMKFATKTHFNAKNLRTNFQITDHAKIGSR